MTVAQENVADLERGKKEVEGQILKKETDIAASQRRLEDEQHIIQKLYKTIKEMQSMVEANEEELEAERQARVKHSDESHRSSWKGHVYV